MIGIWNLEFSIYGLIRKLTSDDRNPTTKTYTNFFYFFFLEIFTIQEPFFTYFFGVREPGFFGAINVSSGKCTLFMPRLPSEYAIWMGELWTCNDFKKRYAVDSVKYMDEVCLVFGVNWTPIFTIFIIITNIKYHYNHQYISCLITCSSIYNHRIEW